MERKIRNLKTINKKLNQILPEYGITLLEFRKKIFESENSFKTTNLKVFKKELQTWKNKEHIK